MKIEISRDTAIEAKVCLSINIAELRQGLDRLEAGGVKQRDPSLYAESVKTLTDNLAHHEAARKEIQQALEASYGKKAIY